MKYSYKISEINQISLSSVRKNHSIVLTYLIYDWPINQKYIGNELSQVDSIKLEPLPYNVMLKNFNS